LSIDLELPPADAAAMARRGDHHPFRLCRIRAERFEANARILID
jgi:hypothetical protein